MIFDSAITPTAGYLQYEHVKLRERLHLLSEPVDAFMSSAQAEQRAMLDLLVEGGWLNAEAAQDVPGHIEEIVEAMHAMLKDAPSLLLQAALATKSMTKTAKTVTETAKTGDEVRGGRHGRYGRRMATKMAQQCKWPPLEGEAILHMGYRQISGL